MTVADVALLVVDDNEDNRYTLTRRLEREGYKDLTIANRNTFLIDPSGKIVKVWTKVDPNVHSGEVLEAIQAAKKG